MKFRSSSFGDLVTGIAKSELTDKQKETLSDMLTKIKLTDKQADERDRLIEKRDSPPELSATGKAMIQKMFREQVRGTMDENISNMYCEKGLAIENFSIKRAAKVNGWGVCVKSDIVLEDEYGIGHPDVYKIGTLGFDVKSSFTDATFPLWEEKLKDTNYIWQAKRYAMMAGLDCWGVVFCLENSPESVVVSHAWKLWRESMQDGLLTDEFTDEVRKLHNFDHLEDWARVKTFRVDLYLQDIEIIKQAHGLGVAYYEELEEKYSQMKQI